MSESIKITTLRRLVEHFQQGKFTPNDWDTLTQFTPEDGMAIVRAMLLANGIRPYTDSVSIC